jgi:hypothetical protein
MPRGVVGDSMDRATDKMDQMISRSKGTSKDLFKNLNNSR